MFTAARSSIVAEYQPWISAPTSMVNLSACQVKRHYYCTDCNTIHPYCRRFLCIRNKNILPFNERFKVHKAEEQFATQQSADQYFKRYFTFTPVKKS